MMSMRMPARSEMSGPRATYVCMVFSRARWSWVSSQPLAEQRVQLRRLLERRHVPALLDHLDAGSRNAVREFLEPCDRHDGVLAPGDDQGGTTDRAQVRPAVDAADDRALLAQERFLAGRERHLAHLADQPDFPGMPRRDEPGRELGHHRREIGLGHRHQSAPVRGGFGTVGAGVGVEEREAVDALRRAAQDLERDVAAHGMAREGETLRGCLRERILGEARDGIGARELRGARGRGLGEPENLVLEDVRVLEQAREEEKGRMRHGHWSHSRAESCAPMLPQATFFFGFSVPWNRATQEGVGFDRAPIELGGMAALQRGAEALERTAQRAERARDQVAEVCAARGLRALDVPLDAAEVVLDGKVFIASFTAHDRPLVEGVYGCRILSSALPWQY